MINKSALVTGGSRGIGLGVAHVLAQNGWSVAINGVRPESAVVETLTELRQHGQKVIYCQGNVANAEDRQRILDQLLTQFGQLNALVNNAGVAPKERNDLLEMSEESYDRVMGINLRGPFFLTQLIAKYMADYKTANPEYSATIVNISSISATIASINRGQYCISKAGMSMMTQLFAVRLGELDIPVYEVRPGVIMTDMTAGVKDKYDRLINEGLCVTPRWGYPEDVGKAVASLLEGTIPLFHRASHHGRRGLVDA